MSRTHNLQGEFVADEDNGESDSDWGDEAQTVW